MSTHVLRAEPVRPPRARRLTSRLFPQSVRSSRARRGSRSVTSCQNFRSRRAESRQEPCKLRHAAVCIIASLRTGGLPQHGHMCGAAVRQPPGCLRKLQACRRSGRLPPEPGCGPPRGHLPLCTAITVLAAARRPFCGSSWLRWNRFCGVHSFSAASWTYGNCPRNCEFREQIAVTGWFEFG